MSHTDAYEADLRGLVEDLEKQDVFALGEAEAWYVGSDEAEVVSDYLMLNEAIVDILDEREGVDEALKTATHYETRACF